MVPGIKLNAPDVGGSQQMEQTYLATHGNSSRNTTVQVDGMMINGVAHGSYGDTMATCQLHMRKFQDGDAIWVEPWRARSFPVIRDLIVDRSPLDKIIQAGGFITVNTGSAPEANSVPIPKAVQENAMDAAECIECGACVAQCPNGAAQLFTAAKVSHLGLLPQGQPERYTRVLKMVEVMEEHFGSCTWSYGRCREPSARRYFGRLHIARMVATTSLRVSSARHRNFDMIYFAILR
jgi:succinate dehydrogenase/fumarate reductase-like Fe-S protein